MESGGPGGNRKGLLGSWSWTGLRGHTHWGSWHSNTSILESTYSRSAMRTLERTVEEHSGPTGRVHSLGAYVPQERTAGECTVECFSAGGAKRTQHGVLHWGSSYYWSAALAGKTAGSRRLRAYGGGFDHTTADSSSTRFSTIPSASKQLERYESGFQAKYRAQSFGGASRNGFHLSNGHKARSICLVGEC